LLGQDASVLVVALQVDRVGKRRQADALVALIAGGARQLELADKAAFPMPESQSAWIKLL
jgi:hypothetical protein